MKVLMIGPGRNVQGGISTVVNQYYEARLDEKIDLKYIPTMEDGKKVKKLFVAMKAIVEFCLCIKKYEIVHVHMSSRASFYRKSHFIKVAYKKKKKIVIHMHGSEFDVFYDQECNDRQKKEIRAVFGLADAVIALSEEWKEYLSKICNHHKIIVIYNAVRIPDYVKEIYTDHNVLFLGRLGERKGVYDLIGVIPEIVKSMPDVHFYIGGDGEVEKCKEMSLKKGVEDHVTFLGWITGDQKERLLKACSVFVLPSYHEGMPMSLLEAMSYGLVVVSTKVGGIPKVVRNDETGYLIEAGDTGGLFKKIIEAVQGKNKKIIGMAAHKEILKNFNIEQSINSLLALYKSLEGVSYGRIGYS